MGVEKLRLHGLGASTLTCFESLSSLPPPCSAALIRNPHVSTRRLPCAHGRIVEINRRPNLRLYHKVSSSAGAGDGERREDRRNKWDGAAIVVVEKDAAYAVDLNGRAHAHLWSGLRLDCGLRSRSATAPQPSSFHLQTAPPRSVMVPPPCYCYQPCLPCSLCVGSRGSRRPAYNFIRDEQLNHLRSL